MYKDSIKSYSAVFAILALALFANHINNLFYDPTKYGFINSFFFIISTSIYFGIIMYWIISVHRRIMDQNIKNQLIVIGVLLFFWMSVRSLRYRAFEFMPNEGSTLWYCFYIPLILIPLIFFYISMVIGRKSNHEINKKWYLLYIPAVILIGLILTNDSHNLFFIVDRNVGSSSQAYTYANGYFVVVTFICGLLIASFYNLIKNFNSVDGKVPIMPVFVLAILFVYSIIYTGYFKNESLAIDFTSFSCIIGIVFWEVSIRSRLIRSNSHHQEIFAATDCGAQILDHAGNVFDMSISSTPLKEDEFEKLKLEGHLYLDNKIKHIAKIYGGYVVWKDDITILNAHIDELNNLSKKLFNDIEILEKEYKENEKREYLERKTKLLKIIFDELVPHSEHIMHLTKKCKKSKYEVKNNLLYEIAVESVFIKRKINLLLSKETTNLISSLEVSYCFKELFQILRFSGTVCEINIVKEFDMPIIFGECSYDLFLEIIKMYDYRASHVLISYDINNDNIRFNIQISGDSLTDVISILDNDNLLDNSSISVVDEIDNYHISLVLPVEGRA